MSVTARVSLASFVFGFFSFVGKKLRHWGLFSGILLPCFVRLGCLRIDCRPLFFSLWRGCVRIGFCVGFHVLRVFRLGRACFLVLVVLPGVVVLLV